MLGPRHRAGPVGRSGKAGRNALAERLEQRVVHGRQVVFPFGAHHQDSRFRQDLEVVGYGRLRQVEVLANVTARELAGGSNRFILPTRVRVSL